VLWERRTAIVATGAHLRAREVDETFQISELLVHDPEDLMHKAVGWLLRSAGQLDPGRLLEFLDEHATKMPRTMLRSAVEKLPPEIRALYLSR
jgi:3-methyladenine DNA glycosylase AlkD